MKKIIQNLKTVKDYTKQFMAEGGHVYVDKKFNLNITQKDPNNSDVLYKILQVKNPAMKKEMKLKQIQQKLEIYGVAFREDIDRLEKEIKRLKSKK